MDAYVRPQDEVSKPKSHPAQSGRNASHNLESEPDRRKSNYESRSRHNREWKGPARDAAKPLCFRSSEIEHMHLDAKGHHDISCARRSLSQLSAAHRKRNWEQPSAKVCVINMHFALFVVLILNWTILTQKYLVIWFAIILS